MDNSVKDTIAAIATPYGRGGIGVVRISGSQAGAIAEEILRKKISPRKAYYLPFYDARQNVIDEGIAIFFKEPHSFTGEDVLELQGHGGPIVLDSILKMALSCGARFANAGEFSERAFLNEKIDLVQAEAIADLIDASSKQAARSAVFSLRGEFSKRINILVNSIIQLRTYVEACIDFPEEEIDFSNNENILKDLDKIIEQLQEVRRSAKQGVLLQEGMHVIIIGEPNVGKSSLLNCLSGRDSAIVTDIAGTTRDVLREYIQIDGMPLHIIDTAGLRETEDKIEKEGVRRAQEEVKKADKVLLMVDATKKEKNIEYNRIVLGNMLDNKSVTVIKNKIDLTDDKPHLEEKDGETIIYLSAKSESGIDILKNHLKKFMGFQESTEGIFTARRRHLEAISHAEENLISGKLAFSKNGAGELLAEELRQAQNNLSKITGEFTTEDLLDSIFSSFCIGK